MTMTFLLALSLLVSAAWIQAQSQYPQTGSTASGQTTVQGCLQGSGGNNTLTTDDGTKYQLQGDTSKLSAHVGNEVQITGSTTSASATSHNRHARIFNTATNVVGPEYEAHLEDL